MTIVNDLSRITRSELEAVQLEKARALLARAATNPFYAPLVRESGLAPDSLTSLDRWRALPLVDKQAMLADEHEDPPYGRRLGVPRSEIRQTHLTSGTSGFGQEALALTAADVDNSGETWRPVFAAMGLRPGELVATFYPVTFLAYGRSVMEGARATGVQVASLAGVERGLAVALMRKLQPAAIGTRPALLDLIARQLAEEATTPRAAFPGLRSIVGSGITPSIATAIEEAWGVRAHEVYGSSQGMGIIATTGPEGAAPGGDCGVMHVSEHRFLAEMLDPETLEPVHEGEAEVVLTCLDRVASPIIRFRTRDRVEVVPPGRAGPPVVGIRVGSIGRYDDMCKVRGNNVWPAQIDEAVLTHPDVADYRCEIELDHRKVDVMRLRVRPHRPLTGAEIDEIAKRVKRTTNVTPVVDVDPDLPEPELKPKRLVDRRKRT